MRVHICVEGLPRERKHVMLNRDETNNTAAEHNENPVEVATAYMLYICACVLSDRGGSSEFLF